MQFDIVFIPSINKYNKNNYGQNIGKKESIKYKFRHQLFNLKKNITKFKGIKNIMGHKY